MLPRPDWEVLTAANIRRQLNNSNSEPSSLHLVSDCPWSSVFAIFNVPSTKSQECGMMLTEEVSIYLMAGTGHVKLIIEHGGASLNGFTTRCHVMLPTLTPSQAFSNERLHLQMQHPSKQRLSSTRHSNNILPGRIPVTGISRQVQLSPPCQMSRIGWRVEDWRPLG